MFGVWMAKQTQTVISSRPGSLSLPAPSATQPKFLGAVTDRGTRAARKVIRKPLTSHRLSES